MVLPGLSPSVATNTCWDQRRTGHSPYPLTTHKIPASLTSFSLWFVEVLWACKDLWFHPTKPNWLEGSSKLLEEPTPTALRKKRHSGQCCGLSCSLWYQHPILSTSCSASNPAASNVPGKAWKMILNTWVPITHLEDLAWVPGSWLQPSRSLAIVESKRNEMKEKAGRAMRTRSLPPCASPEVPHCWHGPSPAYQVLWHQNSQVAELQPFLNFQAPTQKSHPLNLSPASAPECAPECQVGTHQVGPTAPGLIKVPGFFAKTKVPWTGSILWPWMFP